MARTLIILRHGKAEATSPSGLDADRSLTRRGLRQIDFISEQLLARNREPLRIAASFVRRARQSADALAEALEVAGVHCDVRREPALELGHESATTDGLADIIASLLATHRQGPVALIGHNPQLERLTNILAHPTTTGSEPLKTGMACLFTIRDAADPLASASLITRIRCAE